MLEMSDDAVADKEENVLLRANVVVDRALGETSSAADVAHCGRVEAFLPKNFERGADELFAPIANEFGVFADGPSGDGAHGCCFHCCRCSYLALTRPTRLDPDVDIQSRLELTERSVRKSYIREDGMLRRRVAQVFEG
jgi:hypothetical protein